jgi:menaquinone-specific isochorismate synthase
LSGESYRVSSIEPAIAVSLARTLEQLLGGNLPFFAVTVPAPLLSPVGVFLFLPHEQAVLWAPNAGDCEVGLGSSFAIRATGPPSFLPMIAQGSQHLLHYRHVGLGASALGPKFFGGYPFFRVLSHAEHWQGFDGAEFVLPRLLYRSSGTRASLTLCGATAELQHSTWRKALVDATQALFTNCAGVERNHRLPALVRGHVQNPPRQVWGQHVADACRLLQAGELEKVVLAREVVLNCHAAPDVGDILQNLLDNGEDCTRFALRRGASTFLGATPELLVARRGSEIVTEALAGSAYAGGPEADRALLSSDKDRLEHALVVREIVARLRTLGASVAVPHEPRLRRFGPILHLHTPLRARQHKGLHVLKLADQLHPTPAVGGVPVSAAIEFLRSHEEFDRGRYASPIGWFDKDGDGEFCVALRSALVHGQEVRLYAGAGLVTGSKADAEWLETELKFCSLLQAMGLTAQPADASGTENGVCAGAGLGSKPADGAKAPG